MNRRLVLFFLSILVFVGGFYYYVSGIPQYTFYLIYKSVKNHDVESFYRYVDVDSIIDNFMNDAWKESMLKEQPENEWAALGLGLAQAMKPAIKAMLTDLAKQEIANAIEDIKQPSSQDTLVRETPVKGFINEFKSIKDYSKIKIRTKGMVAEVEIPYSEMNEKLTVRMRKTQQRYWKIVSIKLPTQPNESSRPVQDNTSLDAGESFKSNPVYIEYYQGVREKIRKLAYNGYNRTVVGEVFLTFIILSNGEVKDIGVNEEKSSSSPYLRQIAIEAVKASAPFKAFPSELNYPQMSFNVILSYEIE